MINRDLDDSMRYYKNRYRDEYHLARYDPVSLLPDLLAATRTGLSPAGGDELTTRRNTMALRHGVTSHSAGRTNNPSPYMSCALCELTGSGYRSPLA